MYAVTVEHHPQDPRLAGRAPYAVALVDLDDGIRMLTNIVGCDPASVTVGMPVVVRGIRCRTVAICLCSRRREEGRMADLAQWRRVLRPPTIISSAGWRTFADLDARANRLGPGPATRGLAPGDGVALLTGNHPVFVETFFACRAPGSA